MPQRTPKQQRQATARKIEKMLPDKPTKAGETVVSDAILRKVIKDLSK